MNRTETIRWALAQTPENHARTLFGERPAGSKWGRDFTHADWKALLPRWKRYRPPEAVTQRGCNYYRTGIGDLFPDARRGAVPWHKVAAAGLAEHVETVEGAHGPELQLAWAHVEPGTWARRETVATLILGPHGGSQAVFTVHPGEPLCPWRGEHQDFTAVKLV